MYSIYADDVCIYNDCFFLDNMKVVDPKLTMEDSSAGSLSMKLPPSNIGYDTIVRMATDISVKKDGEEIWAGRVLSEQKDFWNNRVLLCEGELAFLNDSTQPPAEYHNKTVQGFLETLISIHNSKVTEKRQFTVGTVTVTDPNDSLYRYTNYEKTIECINDKLIKRLGGHLRVRKVNGVRYLDYLAEYPNTNSQTIEFGKNLLDFTRKWDLTEFATVIVPLGNRLDESPIEALDAYLTVESVNNGSMYVESTESIAAYGWIEKVVNWNDVSTAAALLSKAKQYLSDIQFDNMTIELSALDLHYLNADYESVKLLDEIRVISIPHGMDRYFPVTKLEIPLDQPENTQFTLGDNIEVTLTSVNNATNAETLKKLETLPKASAILEEAKSNATALLNSATNGYITITQDNYGTNTLYVSNNRDYTKATKLWKWNLNGLGYSKDGGKTYGLAITMNGAIVADYITTGTLNADLIKAGTLKDNNSNVTFDLETGTLTMKKGSININGGQFSVSTTGIVNMTQGKIGDLILGDGYISAVNSDAKKKMILRNVQSTESYGILYFDDYSTGKHLYPWRFNGDGSFKLGSICSIDGAAGKNQDIYIKDSALFVDYGLELFGANETGQSYIDFHFKEKVNNASDYTSRIMAESGRMITILPKNDDTRRFQFFIESGDTPRMIFRPDTNGGGYLGSGTYRWNTGFFINTITQSDRKNKNILGNIENSGVEFVKKLNPVFYILKNGDSGRKHMGFIAQEVAQLAAQLEMGDLSLYQATKINDDGSEAYYSDSYPDEQLAWGLNYNELIAPMVTTIQYLMRKLEEKE